MIRALTVRQPWSWAIARGYKPVENRTWATSYRGPLAIHASLAWDTDPYAIQFVKDAMRTQGVLPPASIRDDSPLAGVGRVVAVVDLVDICGDGVHGDCACGPWAASGQMHWRLANPRPLAEPVPAKGRLGLWNIDLEASCA